VSRLRRAVLVLAVIGVTVAGMAVVARLRSPSELRALPATAKASCGSRWGPAVEIGHLSSDLREVSGFVSTPRYPGLAWMVRDSENPATLYSFEIIDRAIRTKPFPVVGAENGDWEDVAYTTGTDGRGRLWIEDNINRHTAPKTIYEVLEPDPTTDRSATVVGRYRWEYPEGNHDTEALFALAGELVVVSKTTPSRAYRFELPLDPDDINRPVPMAAFPAGQRLTLASTSADERFLLTSSTKDQRVWIYEAARLSRGPVFTRSMKRTQREAGDFFPWDGCDIVLISEQRSVWLLKNL
jgi:hypothetical protein